MRKMIAVAGILLVGISFCYAMFRLPTRAKRVLFRPHAPMPQLEVGKFDLFGERPMPEKPKSLSAEEFRKRFKDKEILTLANTATLASLREEFGEPLEYFYEGIPYTHDDLPAWFFMKYPAGVKVRILNQAVAQLAVSEPGYFYQGKLQVGLSLEEVYRIVGKPTEIQDWSKAVFNQIGPDTRVESYLKAGNMYLKDTVKYYRPKDTDVLITVKDDKIAVISLWRPVNWPYLWDVKVRDTSKSLGYLWSQGGQCQKNLEQLGIALTKYVNEDHSYHYPPISSEAGRFAFDVQALFPPDLDNPELLDCPAEKERKGSNSTQASGRKDVPDYRYFGYVLVDEREGMAFLAAYYDHIMNKQPLEQELSIPERALAGTRGHLWRLGEGVERWYIYEINNPAGDLLVKSVVPVLIEMPGHHGVPGGHVLYMDGHVEWLPYPGPFPMTPAFIEGVKAVEERLLQKTSENKTR